MKVFLDTNILLDVLLSREPHVATSAQIWSGVERGEFQGVISAISFNNVYFIVRRLSDRKKAEWSLRILHGTFDVVPVDDKLLGRAIDAGFNDFEDAIQFFSAIASGADLILTRNTSDFPVNILSVLTPEVFLATLKT